MLTEEQKQLVKEASAVMQDATLKILELQSRAKRQEEILITAVEGVYTGLIDLVPRELHELPQVKKVAELLDSVLKLRTIK